MSFQTLNHTKEKYLHLLENDITEEASKEVHRGIHHIFMKTTNEFVSDKLLGSCSMQLAVLSCRYVLCKHSILPARFSNRIVLTKQKWRTEGKYKYQILHLLITCCCGCICISFYISSKMKVFLLFYFTFSDLNFEVLGYDCPVW